MSERLCPLEDQSAVVERCVARGEVDPCIMLILQMGAIRKGQGLNPGEFQGMLPLCGGGPVIMAAKHIQLHYAAARLKVSFAI